MGDKGSQPQQPLKSGYRSPALPPGLWPAAMARLMGSAPSARVPRRMAKARALRPDDACATSFAGRSKGSVSLSQRGHGDMRPTKPVEV